MRKDLSLSIIVLTLGVFVTGCTTAPTAVADTEQPEIPTSLPTKIVFQPGDPTSLPPGSEIVDPDFQAAVEAYKNKDFAQVQESMKRVISRNPELAPPYWYLG